MNRLFGLFHKKIYILWNRPKSLLLTMVQDIRLRKKQADRAVMTRSAKFFWEARSPPAL
ncbi:MULTISPECIES: hypothetical protein [unclassified Microcoleus]|uniref:hypothetical protein n=1 Tax=unclassified Microcoleus TaxID=2642155 RepID=UPI002FD067AC